MSGVFGAHLWKEWRENRGMIVGLGATIAVGPPILVELVRRMHLPTHDLPAIAAATCVVLVVFALGGEVLGREFAADRRCAMARLPGGLARPFVARLLICMAVLVGLSALAYAWTGAIVHWRMPGAIWGIECAGPLAVLALIATGWSLAASCWVRHALLAVPTAFVLLLVLVVAPLLPSADALRDALYPGDIKVIAGILMLSGFIAAWLSFRCGLRRGGSRVAAAMAGGCALLLGCLAVHALAGARVSAWRSLDLEDPGCRIMHGMIAPDGRHAFLSVGHHDRKLPHAVVLDLVSGEVRDLGTGASFGHANQPLLGPRVNPPPTVLRIDEWARGNRDETWLDTASAQPLAKADASARRRAELRERTPWRDAQGRPVWTWGDSLESVDDRGSVIRSALPPGRRIVRLYERGFVFRDGSPGSAKAAADTYGFRDLLLDMEIPLDAGRACIPNAVICVTGGVLVAKFDALRGSIPTSWVMHVPEATEPHAVPHLESTDLPVAGLPDGRLLVTVDAGMRHLDAPPRRIQVRRVEILDLQSGAREPVAFESGDPGQLRDLESAGPWAWSASGKLLLHYSTGRMQSVARFDPVRRTLTCIPEPILCLLTWVDEDTVVGVSDDSRRLVRVRFGDPTVEVLFEVGTARP